MFLWLTHENLNENGTENINNKNLAIWHIWLFANTQADLRKAKRAISVRAHNKTLTNNILMINLFIFAKQKQNSIINN